MQKERYGWEISDKEFRSSIIHGSDRIATALERIAKVLERIAEEQKKQTQYVKWISIQTGPPPLRSF